MPRQRSILSQLLLCAIASVLTCGILSAEVPETLTLTDNSSNDFIVRNVNGHRVAISNHRLISFADGKVTFRWRDSAHHNEQKLLTLSLDEFCADFSCTCSPGGSCVFATLASWPTADAPLRYRSAFSYSLRDQRRRPAKTVQPPMV